MDIPFGTLEGITGIKTRRWWPDNTLISDIATMIGKRAIDESGIDPKRLDCIINCSVSKDFTLEPTLSIICHKNLGLSENCMNFDISCTCAGFSTALEIASSFLDKNQMEYILIIAAESARFMQTETTKRLNKDNIDFKDIMEQIAALTLGSGAVAMIVSKKEMSTTNHIINNSVFVSDTKYNLLTYGEKDYMYIEGKNMLKAALAIQQKTVNKAIKHLGWIDDEIDLYVPHQISKPNNDSFFEVVKSNKKKHFYIYQEFGNQGPAAWPIALYKATKEKDMKNKHIGILSIGSGFNAYCIDITW